ncbi:MAG: nonstructural protein [Microvirus sp.]|nr:MAG: nonstructural protein [Microvirus sp.]
MKLLVFAIFDTALNAHAHPMYFQTTPLAMRSFTQEINRKDTTNQLHVNATDFSLWQLATYDDATGEFTNERQLIARAQDLKQTEH